MTTPFELIVERLSVGNGNRIRLCMAGRTATSDEILRFWEFRSDFRQAFSDLLAARPFEAFRWENPVVSQSLLNRPFECVVLNSPELIGPAYGAPFAEQHIAAEAGKVVEFDNLSGNARLIVPTMGTDGMEFSHLAEFVPGASEPQKELLWQSVSAALRRRISSRPVWLNTAGAGVSWLHVRLDDRPKYYHFAEYKKEVTAK